MFGSYQVAWGDVKADFGNEHLVVQEGNINGEEHGDSRHNDNLGGTHIEKHSGTGLKAGAPPQTSLSHFRGVCYLNVPLFHEIPW